MWGYTSHTYKFLIKNVKLGTSSLCGVTHPTPAVPFLLREKEPKAYQRGSVLFDISSGGSIPRGCRQAAKPPPLVKNSRDRRGRVTALRLLRGHSPQGYLRGVPLDTPFVSFLVKGKIPRCGARSSTKGRFAEILVRSKVSNFSLLPHNKVTSNFLLCGVTHPTPAPTFLCKESRQRYTRNLLVP